MYARAHARKGILSAPMLARIQRVAIAAKLKPRILLRRQVAQQGESARFDFLFKRAAALCKPDRVTTLRLDLPRAGQCHRQP